MKSSEEEVYKGTSEETLMKLSKERKAKIALLGCGAEGSFFIDLAKEDIRGDIDLLYLVNEVNQLRERKDTHILGPERMGMLYNDPEKFLKRGLAEKDKTKIGELVGDNDIVFLIGSVSDGVGTYLIPAVADIFRESDIATVCIVTTPFAFKGEVREKNAEIGLDLIDERPVQTLIMAIERIEQIVPRLDWVAKYRIAFELFIRMVKLIADTTRKKSLVDIDLSDILTFLRRSGRLYFGMGRESMVKAYPDIILDEALASPFLDFDPDRVKEILCLFKGGPGFTVGTARAYVEELEKKVFGVKILVGVQVDLSEGDTLELFILAVQSD